MARRFLFPVVSFGFIWLGARVFICGPPRFPLSAWLEARLPNDQIRIPLTINFPEAGRERVHRLPPGGGPKPMVPFLGVGEFTTHFRTYSSGAWDVHWPWPPQIRVGVGWGGFPLGPEPSVHAACCVAEPSRDMAGTADRHHEAQDSCRLTENRFQVTLQVAHWLESRVSLFCSPLAL